MDRNTQDILEATALLEANFKSCEPYNCFGHDNKKQILIMLDVIGMNRSKNYINSKFLNAAEKNQSQPDNHLWRAAMDAREWLDGLFEIEELLICEKAPSKIIISKSSNQYLD